MEESSPPKKQKLEGETKPPPNYGSQDYWEERYKKHGCDQAADDAALPYHAWYFTYSDLRPLILPILLGGRDEGMTFMGGSERNEDNEEIHGKANGTAEEVDELHVRSVGIPEPEALEEINNNVATEKAEEGVSDEQSDNREVSEGDSGYEEDSDDDEVLEREGLAKDGPVSVIEIGCGDVPLGKDLASDLMTLEATTGAKARNVVKEIVCCDYSSAVISKCKENQLVDMGEDRDTDESKDDSGGKLLLVDYVTADARKLPYPNCSFHLALEKGTLDAMLSDKETGISSCTLIIAECARVLKEGGYIILVSHLNAHTSDGIEWLDEVVITGLRDGGGRHSEWEIEVHGSDGLESVDDDGLGAHGEDSGSIRINSEEFKKVELEAIEEEVASEDEDHSIPPPSGGPGPAVYILHNISKTPKDDWTEEADPPAVALRFFSY